MMERKIRNPSPGKKEDPVQGEIFSEYRAYSVGHRKKEREFDK